MGGSLRFEGADHDEVGGGARAADAGLGYPLRARRGDGVQGVAQGSHFCASSWWMERVAWKLSAANVLEANEFAPNNV